jgi:p-cumate 2,3-dioxygenase subunit alpha
MSSLDLDAMVIDDRERGCFRVHRSSMTAPEVLELERERIFSRSWLYLGHSSEVPEPGDFLRRRVGGRPLILVRSKKDGQLRALFNTCPHRGAVVCRQDSGNASVFQCFYHAWTFDSTGALVGVPDDEAYGEAFDRRERSLVPVPRFDSYEDFLFVSYDPEVPPLTEWLAGACENIDLIVDQSPSRKLRVIEGMHRYSTRANWKLLAENSIDGYHGMPTHQTYFAYIAEAGGLLDEPGDGPLPGSGRVLGNGHTSIEYAAPFGRPVARWVPQMGEQLRQEIDSVRRELVERCGEERAKRIAERNRNMLIFPNLVINDIMGLTVRTFNPVAPDFIEITAFALAPVEEAGSRLHTRLRNYLEFLGPAGFATPDDVEALESCQLGFTAGGVEYSDISRGMLREATTTDELHIRGFWRQWHALMTGREISDWGDRPVVAAETRTDNHDH